MDHTERFADDKFNVGEMISFLPDSLVNIVGKGENANYQHFFPFPTMFSKGFFLRVINVGIVQYSHYHTLPHFDALKIYSCGKHCEKMFSTPYGSYFSF